MQFFRPYEPASRTTGIRLEKQDKMKYTKIPACLLCFIAIYSCGINNKNALRNKYLIYSSVIKNDNSYLNDFFYVNIKDTIYYVMAGFGYRCRRTIVVDSIFNVVPYPCEPSGIYTSSKTKKQIKYHYLMSDCGPKEVYYPRKAGDTIFSGKYVINWVLNTGIDTVLHICGNKFKCNKFLRTIDCVNGTCYQEEYIERNTGIPLYIIKIYI